MTAPILQGFPDWGRSFAEAQVLEVNSPIGVAAGTVNLPNRYVGNAKSLIVFFKPAVANVKLTLDFWGEQGALTHLDAYQFDVQAGDTVRQPVPILGPYMSLTATPFGGGAWNYILLVWRNPAAGYFHGQQAYAAMTSNTSVAIGGSASTSVHVPEILEGPATWTVSMTGGNWQASINAIMFDGSQVTLDHTDNTSPSMAPRALYLPPAHIRFDLVNQNAAAQQFSLFATRIHNR